MENAILNFQVINQGLPQWSMVNNHGNCG